MVLVLDGNSEHVAHAYGGKQVYSEKKKSDFLLLKPLTDQLTKIVLYMRNYTSELPSNIRVMGHINSINLTSYKPNSNYFMYRNTKLK